jgi:hypothetical protein
LVRVIRRHAFGAGSCLVRHPGSDAAGDVELGQQFGIERNVGVALDHGRHARKQPHRLGIEIPDVGHDRVIVGVDDMAALVEVAGEVELPHALARHAAQERQGVVLVVEGADIDVVDVEQDLAVGTPAEFGDEFPLGEFRRGIGDVARDVLQDEPAAEVVLHPHHALGDVLERLLGIG